MLHALTAAEKSLGELEPRAGRTGVDDEARRTGVDDEARRIVGRVHAELSFLRVSDAIADLPDLLADLRAATAEVHTAVTGRYFLDNRAIEWSA